MFLFPFEEQVQAVSRTTVACSLTVRARFRARLHHGVVLHVIRFRLLGLPLLGKSCNPDDGKSHRDQTDSA